MIDSQLAHRRPATATPPRLTPAPPPARARTVGWALVAVAGLVGLVVRSDVAHPWFQRMDDRWLSWMGGPHQGLPQAVASGLDWFGRPSGMLVTAALLLLLLGLRRPWSALYALSATLLSSVVVQVLKHLVDRPRPPHPLVVVDHGSFPSGHAASAATLVVILAAVLVPVLARRWWWLLGGTFTVLMMWSRTWLHAHWLSDTVVGALVGAGVALLLWQAFASLIARDTRRGVSRASRSAAPASTA